ncbi:MAG: hypothetical protein CMO80_02565 [Verrucomicrobiales bacterium]|nr:hypothetical protein [Verrucomicrobiales bacterium]
MDGFNVQQLQTIKNLQIISQYGAEARALIPILEQNTYVRWSLLKSTNAELARDFGRMTLRSLERFIREIDPSWTRPIP